MSDQKPLIYGIIHIGSSNVSMRIVQYNSVKDIRVIESVRKDTTFGEEVFNQKRLSFPSIKKLCRMLEGLKQLPHGLPGQGVCRVCHGGAQRSGKLPLHY